MKLRVLTECTMYRTYECEVPDSTPVEQIEDAVAGVPKKHLKELDDVDDDEEQVSIALVNADGTTAPLVEPSDY